MDLLLATTNRGKQAELQEMLKESEFVVVLPTEVSRVKDLEVAETGTTFRENAVLKAVAFANRSKMMSVADDSGLMVSALDDEPGVKSARWIPGSDQERNAALLNRLESSMDRSARFVSVVCLARPDKTEPVCFVGEVTGKLAREPRGATGFGYDPIFIPDGYEKTFAELGVEIKNKLSHRAKAFSQLRKYLEDTATEHKRHYT